MELHEYYLSVVGMKSDDFWTSTLRELGLYSEYAESEIERYLWPLRRIEFAQYNSQFSMNGKKLFPTIKNLQDLYPLSSDEQPEVFTGDEAISYLDTLIK